MAVYQGRNILLLEPLINRKGHQVSPNGLI